MTFLDKITAKWNEGKFVCVGLDKGDFEFDKAIIETTSPFVCAYKPNTAFYEARGSEGWKNLEQTVNFLKTNHPDIAIILDAKRGDIDNTNEAYVKSIFDGLGVDAVTIQPLLGKESIKPFLIRKDRGIFILIKTSNMGADEFQDLSLVVEGITKPLYKVLAEHVSQWNNEFGNLGIVVGATQAENLKEVRSIVGDMPILVPGVGAQGGDLEATLKNGLNSKKQGLIISSSRGIIFASDPRKAAEDLHNQITEILKNV